MQSKTMGAVTEFQLKKRLTPFPGYINKKMNFGLSIS